jgi:hypothetical protein
LFVPSLLLALPSLLVFAGHWMEYRIPPFCIHHEP